MDHYRNAEGGMGKSELNEVGSWNAEVGKDIWDVEMWKLESSFWLWHLWCGFSDSQNQ